MFMVHNHRLCLRRMRVIVDLVLHSRGAEDVGEGSSRHVTPFPSHDYLFGQQNVTR